MHPFLRFLVLLESHFFARMKFKTKLSKLNQDNSRKKKVRITSVEVEETVAEMTQK